MKIFLPEHMTPARNDGASISRTIVADLVGLGVLAAFLSVAMLIFGVSTSRHEFLGILFALAVIAVGMWHVEKSPYAQASQCIWATICSVGLGAIFFGVDMIVGHWNHPELPLIQAAMKSPGPLGFALTVIACPISTIIAMASTVRCWIL
jgi:hypothetical protein